MNGAQAIRQTLDQQLAAGSLHLLGEALELSPATTGLLAAHPQRVHLLPAADAGLVGLATGLCLSGSSAVVELADPSALAAALAMLVEADTLGRDEFPLRLVLRVPCGPDAAALPLAGAPGVAIASPSSAAELQPMLRAALSHGRPVVLLEPRSVLATSVSDLPELPLGTLRCLREGEHGTVLAFGPAVAEAMEAAELLAAEGVQVEVLDLRSLRPLDLEGIAAHVSQTGRAVLTGADGLLSQVVQAAFLRLEAPVGLASPSSAAIAAAMRATLQY
jgi:pyruvate/2-oxoglutarate/acetoin dehydrogenase E1 component